MTARSGRAGRARAAVAAAALLGTGAGATSVDFGVAYRSGGATLLDAAWAQVGVGDLRVAGGTARLAVSTRAVTAAYSRSLAVPPLGAVTAGSEFAVTYAGGVRASSRVAGTAGPLALHVSGTAFTVAATDVDPLAAWAEAPTDLRARGFAADVSARYRVNRTLVVVAGGEFGAQPHGSVGVEGRRDLVTTVPPAEEDDPAAPPETAVTGTVTWRAGARAGRDVLGVTAGVGYTTPDGVSVGVDGLVGPRSVGVTAGVSAADVLGEGSTLRLYGAYEPWRVASTPLRAGVEYGVPVGPGDLAVTVAGGRDPAGRVGVAARVQYRWTLGAGTP